MVLLKRPKIENYYTKQIMKILKIFSLIITGFIFFSCTHINEIPKYNLEYKNFLFKYRTNPAPASVYVDINTSYESSNPLVIILSGIGSAYSEGEIREKLENAVNADSLAYSISEGLKDGLNTYYKINIVKSLDEDPQFIVETRLDKFRLFSNSYGIFANVNCTVLIIDRYSANTVWENSENSTLPINDVFITCGETTLIRTTTSIINAVRLMNMSSEEIKLAISNSVREAGEKQSDQLREDIANKY